MRRDGNGDNDGLFLTSQSDYLRRFHGTLQVKLDSLIAKFDQNM